MVAITPPRHERVCKSAAMAAVVENSGKWVESCLLEPQPLVEKPFGKEAVPTTMLGFAAYALKVTSISAPVPL